MKKIILSLIPLLFSPLTVGQPAISIMPLQGDKNISLDHPKTLTGRCGSSVVRVEGITRLADDYFKHDFDRVKIVLQQSGVDQLTIEDKDDILNDYNGLACIDTESGARLLFWSYCGGGMCGDSLKFHLLNADKPGFVTSPKGECDAKCASNHLRQHPLPLRIGKRFSAQFGDTTSTVAMLDNEGSEACSIPGQPIHWITDYCMMKQGSIDLNNPTVSACIAENNVDGLSDCEAKKRHKRKMCELEAAREDVDVGLCMAGKEITGLTVRNAQRN